jgi:tetratricopeptide (TPR) repeat protein
MKPEARGTSDTALFISRAGADADFAATIGAILEAACYAVTLQQWDFANRNFMQRMHAALSEGARVIALLSPEYLRSEHCQAEWQNAIADDPLNTKSRLILLRVAECEPVGLLRGLAYWDLVPIRNNRSLLEQTVREAVRTDPGREAAVGPYWRAPRTIIDREAIRPVPSFSGREAELAATSAALANDGAIAALYGLGGVGKSSVAREYAWRNRDQYAVIWWLNAQTEDGIIDGLLRLGTLFARGLDQLKDRRAAAQQVTGSILSGFAKPVLLIFDNLEDERLLRAWQPRTGARAVVTSRNAAWSAGVTTIALDAWRLETAIKYLQRESGRTDLADADARAIAEALGALPLALSHAAASLRGMRMVTPQRYLERINEYLKNAPRAAEYPRSVFATFSASIAQAEHQAAGAAAVLCFAAQFAPDAIPEQLFTQPIDCYSEGLGPIVSESDALDLRCTLVDDLRLDEALGTLDRLSLLAFAASSRTYAMHRLVQLASRDLVGSSSREWSECAVEVADAAFPKVRFETWPQCGRLLPHARAALDALPDETVFLPAGSLAQGCAVYLYYRGEYSAACELYERALLIRQKALSLEHPDVGYSLSDLASVYREQGRYEEAESLHKRALATLEKALGPEHSHVATSLNNLANVYEDQGRYEEAEQLHIRALAIKEKAFGPRHSDIAFSLTNLANVYREQGRYEEAELLHKRAQAIWEKALGPEHPEVAHSLNGLANVYREQGRHEEAELLHKRALAIWERALGPGHPDVATALSDLARLYEAGGRRDEAEPLCARALSIREEALGQNNAKTKELRNRLTTLRSK